MPKVFYCTDCGRRLTKPEAIVSRFTGRAYHRDEQACAAARAALEANHHQEVDHDDVPHRAR